MSNREKKTVVIKALILELLKTEPEVSIRSIASAAQVFPDDETERKVIQRAINSLRRENIIIPKGAGRSRVYVLRSNQTDEAKPSEENTTPPDGTNPFKGVELSSESKGLLTYVSQALKERAPVGYDQDFLRGYEPNVTSYLGAEQTKILHGIGQVEMTERPAGTYARNILNRLLIDLSWNSSRLEGNTYSLLETKRLIELGEVASGKDAAEAQMILNHKAAIEYVVESVSDKQIAPLTVRNIHALLSENLLGDPAASGWLRTINVGIAGTTYLPLESPQLIQECFNIFIDKLNEIHNPFEQSLFSIVHLSYLQAFEDVNKRTARLVANIPLIKENLRPLSFMEVDQSAYVSALLGVYEKNDVSLIRDLYCWAYHRSSQRYTAIQQAMGEPNLLKLRYREVIQEIVRSLILEKVTGDAVVQKLREAIDRRDVAEDDRDDLFNLIETELISLHDGNIARFKVLPSEFKSWKELS